MYLENIAIIGYLGKDPTTNQVNGKTVCNFSVGATNPRTKKTTWYRIATWEKHAETCMKFLSKGKAVYVDGIFEIKDWVQKDGTKEKLFEITARNVQFLSPQETKQQEVQAPSNDGYGVYSDVPF